MTFKPVRKNLCPECEGETKVLRTYYTDIGEVMRRRCCKSCDHRYWTVASGEEPLSNRNFRVRYPSRGSDREKNRLVRIEKQGTWQSSASTD